MSIPRVKSGTPDDTTFVRGDQEWAPASSGGGTVTDVTATAPIASSGGTTPNITHNTTAVTPGPYTYGSFTVDAYGHLTDASSGATPALASVTLTAGTGLTGGGDLSANRTFNVGANADGSITVNADDIQLGSYALVSRSTNAGPNTVNLGALSSGVLQHAVSGAVSTPSVFAAGANRVATGSGTNGGLTDSANLTFASNTLTVTGTTPLVIGAGSTGVKMSVRDPDNTAGLAQTIWYPASGSNVTPVFYVSPRGTGFSSTYKAEFSVFNTDYVADASNYELLTARAIGASGFVIATGKSGTGTNRPLMLASGWASGGALNANQVLLNANGTVTMSSLGTGLVKSTSGLLSNASAGTDYQGVITWPIAGEILVSNGTAANPVGHAEFMYDSSDIVSVSGGTSLAVYNLGSLEADTNYERARLFRSGNVYFLKSEKKGSGTVRSITIDADTSTLTLNANAAINLTSTTGISVGTAASTGQITMAAGTSVTVSAGTGTHPSALFQQDQLTIDTSRALSAGFPGASLWDGLHVTGNATVPGTGTVTSPFGSTTFASGTITGTGVGATVSEAATVIITGGPSQSGLTINAKFSLWVLGDPARFDGSLVIPTTNNGAVATSLTGVGPAGSHTTVQKWWKVQDSSLTDYYIPMF